MNKFTKNNEATSIGAMSGALDVIKGMTLLPTADRQAVTRIENGLQEITALLKQRDGACKTFWESVLHNTPLGDKDQYTRLTQEIREKFHATCEMINDLNGKIEALDLESAQGIELRAAKQTLEEHRDKMSKHLEVFDPSVQQTFVQGVGNGIFKNFIGKGLVGENSFFALVFRDSASQLIVDALSTLSVAKLFAHSAPETPDTATAEQSWTSTIATLDQSFLNTLGAAAFYANGIVRASCARALSRTSDSFSDKSAVTAFNIGTCAIVGGAISDLSSLIQNMVYAFCAKQVEQEVELRQEALKEDGVASETEVPKAEEALGL